MVKDKQSQIANKRLKECVLLIRFPDIKTAEVALKDVRGYSMSTKGSRNTILTITLGSYHLCQQLANEGFEFIVLQPHIIEGIHVLGKMGEILATNLEVEDE